ncbi:MAG TPA: ATPase, T2SS/T4P/T4SS family [Candidatus Omnitrophota bacterium]|nr:ATPase, T2SS/T4P/T4SS family [Candidatus Omnitrophota bacterium]
MLRKQDHILSQSMIEHKLLSADAMAPLLQEAEAGSESFMQVLLKKGFSERELLAVLSETMKLAVVDLRTVVVEKAVLDKVPVKIASYYKFFPLKIKERLLTIAVAFPLDIKTQDEIRTQLGFDVEIVLAPSGDIAEVMKRYYGLGAETLNKIFQDQALEGITKGLDSAGERPEDIEKLAEDASVIKLVNQIILEAFRKRATDIHIEPYRAGAAFRYRIDGILYDANVPAEIKNFLNAIISRIKIMSNLNIVERRMPQDGRAVVRVQDQVLDLRISTIPTPYGESVVIRILPAQMLFSLEKLGLVDKEMQLFERLILKPHGIIFVTGPTGSGKTTTLYACLSRINTKDRKIITIEDPIEYEMSGITQIQVQSEIGLDFARGLRSILRHDPDVIMVGEVRDFETAEIAIRVALTGHLVFSTLHTNDAASGISRLIDIGVEPYLLASSVEAFIAQRLIRVICPYCKKEDSEIPLELRRLIAQDLGLHSLDEVHAFKGKGCEHCNFTGYFGRTAIYEILLVDDVIRDLIIKKSVSEHVKRIAVTRGMKTLRQDGWLKVLAGISTPEEVMKVSTADEVGAGDEKFIVPVVPQEPEMSRGPHMKEAQQADSSGTNNRVYQRIPFRTNLTYRLFKSFADVAAKKEVSEFKTVTWDISAGGVTFICRQVLSAGCLVELKLDWVDGGTAIECLAKIVRVDATDERDVFHVAVVFLDIAGVDRARVEKYIDSNSPGEKK